MRLLLIDDAATANESLCAALEPRGFSVSGCAELERAKALHLDHPFDAVLIDATRQGIDGIDFCNWVRALPDGDRVAIVVSLAALDQKIVTDYLSSGSGDVLCCPLDPRTIHVDIEAAIHQRAM